MRRGVTTIIIDNAKSRGRSRRIESACLERSITDPILSYRLLGHSASIRAENSHLFCITANSPEVSHDLITRSVVVNLYHEGDPRRRKFSIADPEGYAQEHRVELLGELMGMVERWKASGMPMANVNTRFNKRGWGNLIGGILAAGGQKDFLDNSEASAVLLDETRREFAELVTLLATQSGRKWTAAQLVEVSEAHHLLQRELGTGTTRSKTTRMGLLAGRYVSEQFPFSDDCAAIFRRSDNGKVNEYSIEIPPKNPDV